VTHKEPCGWKEKKRVRTPAVKNGPQQKFGGSMRGKKEPFGVDEKPTCQQRGKKTKGEGKPPREKNTRQKQNNVFGFFTTRRDKERGSPGGGESQTWTEKNTENLKKKRAEFVQQEPQGGA